MRHLSKLWLFALATVAFTACSSEDELAPAEAEKSTVQVMFTLSMGEATQGTRASVTENGSWTGYTTGNEWVNEHNIDNLQIVICKKDGTILDVVNDVTIYGGKSSTGDVVYTYSVNGTWKISDTDLTEVNSNGCKVMVIANSTTITKSTDLSTLAFDWNKNTETTPNIPMWGVTTVEANKFKKGEATQLNDIDLLRAVAKVKVVLTDEAKKSGFTLQDVTLHNYNTKGYVVPTSDNSYKSLDATKNLTFAKTLHEYSSAASSTASFQMKEKSNNQETEYLYIPEYNNKTLTDNSKVSYISLGVLNKDNKELKNTKSEDGSFTLEFKDYSDGQPQDNTLHDILRNHEYVYNVNITEKQEVEVTVTLKYQVREWTDKGSTNITFN